MALKDEAKRVADEFEFSTEQVQKAVKKFQGQMKEGLGKTGSDISQIPTFVTSVPNGTETGLYMAVDLGGTNFRVCSVQLHGNSTFSLTQSKVAVPRELMVAKTSQELFAFLAKQIDHFLQTHHSDRYYSHTRRRPSLTVVDGNTVTDGWTEEQIFNLGFTFSFPVYQNGINRGTLMRWTKGFNIPDTIGQDVCALLQQEIDKLRLPVRVAALVNDTVGTLMSRSYTSPGKTGTLLGAIFGTGTNGAYVEKRKHITKLQNMEGLQFDNTSDDMIINTEWGSFDNDLEVLPQTPYDNDLDRESVNPGIQMFEKRISGMFLGEVLRRAMLSLVQSPNVPLFSDENSSLNDIRSTTCIADNSGLWNKWGVDTSFLSIAHGDESAGLRITRQALDRDYGITAVSEEDAQAVKVIATAIGRRSARLGAVAIAAVVLQSGKLEQDPNELIDVGVDGSVVEFFPGYEDFIREALREVPGIGVKGEKRIRIGIAKDGSGVGAALIALVAAKVAPPTEDD
ncbi:MAG: glucokinase [Bogoriella megaspora]|nr:MAG: glucokinase [Bogoriella megaspora]